MGVIAGTVVADHRHRHRGPPGRSLHHTDGRTKRNRGCCSAKAGKYTIYYEYRSEVDGQAFDTDHDIPTGLKVTITDAKGNTMDSLQRYDGDLSVSSSGIAGKAVFTFRLTEPGNYFVAGPNRRTPGRATSCCR